MAASDRLYLDYNATAPLRPAAREAASAAMALPSNPSSVHAEGRRARAIVEAARAAIADLVGARADGVVFTSGATEAAHLALSPDLAVDGWPGFDRLIVSAVEHAAVLRGHRFPADRVATLPVLRCGTVDRAALEGLLAGPRAVVALQAANNETGVIQPIAEIAAQVRAAGGLLVCDAVQAAGRVDCTTLGADILLLSGHKLGGLPGAGALVLASDRVALGAPVLRGGGQERGFRSGTENVPALAAFGAAAAASRADEPTRFASFRDAFEAALLTIAPDAVVFGAGAVRLPNTSAFAVPGVSAERLLIALDLAGLAVSSGSACASGVVGRSHVLEAMGVSPDLRRGALRVSFGWASAADDAVRAARALEQVLGRMRGRQRAAA